MAGRRNGHVTGRGAAERINTGTDRMDRNDGETGGQSQQASGVVGRWWGPSVYRNIAGSCVIRQPQPVWCLSSLAVTRNCLPRTFRVIPVDGPIQHTAIFVGIQISGCAFIAFQQFRRAFHFGRLILQVKNSLHKCRRQWWNLLPSIAVRRLLAMCESRAIILIIDRIRCPYSFCYLIMKKCQFS